MFDTPILFVVFNRPDTTAKVFAQIRAIKPKKLFIAADGPRLNNELDQIRCLEVKEIVSAIDWPCELKTLYRDQNLGCGKAVSGAINWFFEQVDAGIILEDDTVPNKSFFEFCAINLEKYKDDARVGHISGSNFQLGKKWSNNSYYFSKYPMIWGWASWRRAWQKYDFNLSDYDKFQHSETFWGAFTDKEVIYWKNIFDNMHGGFNENKFWIDTWDYQWIYTCWKNNFYTITPNVNLVTNIGFGSHATHTVLESRVSNLKTEEILYVKHSENIIASHEADRRLFGIYFQPRERLNELRNLCYKFLPVSILNQLRKIRKVVLPNLK